MHHAQVKRIVAFRHHLFVLEHMDDKLQLNSAVVANVRFATSPSDLNTTPPAVSGLSSFMSGSKNLLE